MRLGVDVQIKEWAMSKFFILSLVVNFFVGNVYAGDLFVATGKYDTTRRSEGDVEAAKENARNLARKYFGQEVRQISDWVNGSRFNPRYPYSGSFRFTASFVKASDTGPYTINVEGRGNDYAVPADVVIGEAMEKARKSARFYCNSEIIEPAQWIAARSFNSYGVASGWDVTAKITCQ